MDGETNIGDYEFIEGNSGANIGQLFYFKIQSISYSWQSRLFLMQIHFS